MEFAVARSEEARSPLPAVPLVSKSNGHSLMDRWGAGGASPQAKWANQMEGEYQLHRSCPLSPPPRKILWLPHLHHAHPHAYMCRNTCKQ